MPGQRAHGVDGGLDPVPGGGHLHAGLGEEILAVVHERGVGHVGHGEELVPVTACVPDRLNDVVVPEIVHGQLEDPLVGGELGDPHDVHGDDVVGVGLGLGVVDEGLTLLIRFFGQLDERDLLIRVLLVPLIEVGLHHARGEVLALNPGDRARAGEVGGRAASTGVAFGAGAAAPRAATRAEPWMNRRRGNEVVIWCFLLETSWEGMTNVPLGRSVVDARRQRAEEHGRPGGVRRMSE